MREVIEEWLTGKTAGVRRTSWTQDRDYLKPVIQFYGDLPVQDLEKSHIDRLLKLLETGELPRENPKYNRKPWCGRSRDHLLTKLAGVLDSEVRRGRLGRNPALLVTKPIIDSKKRKTFTVQQLQALLDGTKDDRTGIAWVFGSLGLRRAEIAGIRWQDIDMQAHTIKICHTRVVVDGHDEESTPKTWAGNRTLPIPEPVYSALLRTRAMQTRDRMTAEGKYQESGYVVVDELGRPYRAQYLTKLWNRASKRLNLPAITLHDERHTCATLYIRAGVDPDIVKTWLGHTSVRFTLDTYVDAKPDDLLKAAQVHAELSKDVSTERVNKAS